MTTKTCAILLGMALLPAGNAIRAETVERDFHETFAVTAGAGLELFHEDGDVSLEPWDRDIVDVQVHYRADFRSLGWASEPGFEVDFERRGQTILVRGRETGGRGIGVFTSRKLDYTYTIRAPNWVILKLRGDDGDVRIEGWRASLECVLDDGDVTLSDFRGGNARLKAEDGDVEITSFDGDLEIRLDDGDVDIRDCDSGDLQIRTEDGDVTMADCRGNFDLGVEDGEIVLERAEVSDLRIRSSDGDVDVDLLSAKDLDLEIEVEDGDVVLALGAGISATYVVETEDGHVRLPGGEGSRSDGVQYVRGKIGDGSGSVRIRTSDGDVTLSWDVPGG